MEACYKIRGALWVVKCVNVKKYKRRSIFHYGVRNRICYYRVVPKIQGIYFVSSVYQLSNSELFDESTRPSEEERNELKEKIRSEILKLLSKQGRTFE